MAQQYDYDNIQPTIVDPALFTPKPKPTPRKPLPAVLITAIEESAATGEPRAFVLPVGAPERAAPNLVNRIRDYADKNGGHGLRSKVEGSEAEGWIVSFKIQPKRVRNASPTEADVAEAANAAEELHQDLDAVVEEALSEPPAEAVPAEKPKRSPRRK